MRAIRWIKRNPFTFLDILKFIGIMALLVMAINYNIKLGEQANIVRSNSSTIKSISQNNQRLLQDNNRLQEQNKALSQQNQRYLKCNFLAFAHFTQTFRPIQDNEINNCDAVIKPLPQENDSGGVASPVPKPQPPHTSVTKPSSSSPLVRQHSPSLPSQSQPGLVKQILNFLEIR